MKSKFLFFTLLLGLSIFCKAQTQNDFLVSGKYDLNLVDFIHQSEAKFGIKVFFKEDWFKDQKLQGEFDEEPFITIVNNILTPLSLKTQRFDARTFIILPQEGFRPANLELSDKPASSDDIIAIGNAMAVQGNSATISGFIFDGKTGEVIAGAGVFSVSSGEGVNTDKNGFYKIEVPLGKQQFRVSYVGYENGVSNLNVLSSGTHNMELYDQITVLNSVTVTADAPDENIRSVSMGVESLDIKTVKRLPVLLGEADVVKSLTLLPGVTTVGEGAAGFNVRGGSVGENLILQDGAELFNSSHLFGFFSAFNPDLVEDLTLYKGGGIEADKGGRLSSVLDVHMRGGDKEKIQGKGGLGSLMGRFSMEGPIIKEKSSFSFGGRTTYSDWLLKQYDDLDLQRSKAGFSDFNLKISSAISAKDNLDVSAYVSEDYFKLASDTLFTYGTRLASLKWGHSFSDKFFSSTTASMGNYHSNIEDEAGTNQFIMKSQIDYASLSQEFVYSQVENHEIKFGAKGIRYQISQGDLIPNENSINVTEVHIPQQTGIESAFYVSDAWRVSDNLSVSAGLRYSMFNNIGEGEVNVYQEGVPMTEESVINTISYGKGESIQSYGGLEPRINLRFSLNSSSSIKGGYNRLRQYMHLVSNTAAVTPVDLWQMSNTHVRPAISDQFTIGYFKNFNDDEIEASVEAYYKTTTDILDYKGGAKLLLNNYLEADLLQGEGRARGIEFSIKKKVGQTTGWISYTYARTEIRAVSEFPQESVNGGNYYPANYDKPHNISMVMTQKLSKRVTFNANFLYSTGRPITIPSSVYRIGPFRGFPNFSRRNEFRIPDYHRLDVSLTFDQGFKKERKVKSQWNFSIYNLYGRKNAYSIYFTDNSRAYKLAVLGFVPSISYNFIF
jgi:hypothetical protein